MPFPTIESERLRLTEIHAGDDAAIFRLFSDEAVVRFYDLGALTSMEQAREIIQLHQSRYAARTGIRWAIRLNGSDDLIGTCGFNAWSPRMRNAVIGYDLTSGAWGQGYATEAVRAIVAFAFAGHLPCGPVHRIQADTVPGNRASEVLLLKLGFKEEGLRRAAGYWKDGFHDLKCFGLLQPEFKA